jgi:hypothetical protein
MVFNENAKKLRNVHLVSRLAAASNTAYDVGKKEKR